ncbi:hydroxysteroid dehydrogenase [Zopfia rhizophila CBS 207.26]|uniref:Hydroxysteroid dehydrogenase n=1 Tax=Zopfia rhizophila CBS 207.26 TaxID=1314779 RepID=A0A6A6E1E7_9PEZI|nr:hydroxysteroid dehydrogenase [Zopfia rhizophila CBS 207.26]
MFFIPCARLHAVCIQRLIACDHTKTSAYLLSQHETFAQKRSTPGLSSETPLVVLQPSFNLLVRIARTIKMDPVLVIGGCGSLGHHIVKQLLESGGASDVTVFDVKTENNIIPNAKYVKGSLRNQQDVLEVLQQAKPRTIIHTASPSMLGQRNTRQVYEDVNVKGTENLLNAIREVGVTKALVYTSSSSVIHDNMTDLVYATENHPYCLEPKQKVYYTHTKAVAEMMILGANRKDGLLTTVIRGCTIFGEGDNAMPTQIGSAKAGRNRLQVGDGKNMYDWTYVGNTAHAHILAAKALLRIDLAKPPTPEDEAKRVDGEAFVITNDEPWPFWEFIRTVGATAGYPVKKEEIWVVPAWLFYAIAVVAEWSVWAISLGRRESHMNREMVKYLTMTRTFDITKAKERLGYRPQVGVREGIQRAVDAYLSSSSPEAKKEN